LKTIIINYQAGNHHSVCRKLTKLGVEFEVSSDYEKILHADRILLPGVGHFGKAMESLKQLDLIKPLNEAVLERLIPVMGICLGMQLMTQGSEEGGVEGLGWFDAKVVRFKVSDAKQYKIPHIGWNRLKHEKPSKLWSQLNELDEFYFVHAYHVECMNRQDVLATSVYDYSFVSAIEKDNLIGVQFHPEKSHEAGLQMLRNFINQ
jgi:imidazole glycerol-phosphate synthase subunit HisH